MKFSAVLPALMTLPLLASAHFTLDYPTSRGFDENIEPRASDGLTNLTRVGPPNRFDALLTEFCGGFPTPSSERTPFPLSGSAPVLIDSHHPSAIVGMFISFDSNPTSFSQFNQTSSGQQYGLLDNFGSITGSGEVRNKFPRPRLVSCWPPANLACPRTVLFPSGCRLSRRERIVERIRRDLAVSAMSRSTFFAP
jgi:hypothetical protein